MIGILITTWAASALLGQAPAMADIRNTPDERLASMQGAMKGYEVAREGARPASIRLRDVPAFRVGRQKGNLIDGAIFLWLGDDGRPEAAAQVFLFRDQSHPAGKWIHEFTSLADGPLVARREGAVRWSPDVPGVAFKAVPGAPRPAATPAQRPRQVRALAEGFKAEDDLGAEGRITALRLLTTPVARYGKGGSAIEDGALFAFVDGTDPEVFLFVEARKGGDGLEWQYACAPMSCWPLKVLHEGAIVWDVPRRYSDGPSRPFYSIDDLDEDGKALEGGPR